MNSQVFKKGDRILLVRNNSCGGSVHGRYGRSGEFGRIFDVFGVNSYDVIFDKSGRWYADGKDMIPFEQPYDPTQIGDTEEDI